jgi:predicted transcriptional regulator
MQEQSKQVRDVMIDVFEFPHVPYWFTVRQVSGILKKTISGGKCLRPLAVLVFDEKYNLVGHLDSHTILRGMKPAMGSGSPENGIAEAMRVLSEQPAGSLMSQSRIFVDPEDSLASAAEKMVADDLTVLPVLEQKKKLVGIVRSLEVFEFLTGAYFRV